MKRTTAHRYNTRTQGKSAKLHPPTLAAVFKLIAMQEQKEPEAGAAGIQTGRKVRPVFLPGVSTVDAGTLCHDLQLSGTEGSVESERKRIRTQEKQQRCPAF